MQLCLSAMSAAGSGPWYRAVGWSYLRYSNVCADLLRNVLKEPAKTKALQRQVIAYKYAPYADGKATQATSEWGALCLMLVVTQHASVCMMTRALGMHSCAIRNAARGIGWELLSLS